jgi:hypothetical protein
VPDSSVRNKIGRFLAFITPRWWAHQTFGTTRSKSSQSWPPVAVAVAVATPP